MAKTAIPGPLERRHLIQRDWPEARFLAVAEAYLAEGRELEAVDFLRRAGAEERLQELRGRAVEQGDVFLLRAVATAVGTPPDREEWRRLGEAARAAGKDRYAEDARRQAEREEE